MLAQRSDLVSVVGAPSAAPSRVEDTARGLTDHPGYPVDMARTKKSDPPAAADPDRLTRQEAGTYRTTDDRFEVREADAGWFVLDTERTNEFGQELIHGPFATLKAARSRLAEHRSASGTPKRQAPAGRTRKPSPPPRPRTWIDDLAPAEAREVRGLIAALEAAGIADAEAVVRRDRDGLFPAVATRLIEKRLADLVAEIAAEDRALADDLVRRVADLVSGSAGRGPLPGWALVELPPGSTDPPNRRIDLRS